VEAGIAALERVERALIGMGVTQVLTDSMVGPTKLERFRIPEDGAVRVRNPLGVETSFLRPSMVPGVVEVMARNLNRGSERVAVFEIGKTFTASGENFGERYTLTLGMCGLSQEKTWHARPRDVDFFDVKGVVESLGALLGVPVTFAGDDSAGLHPGRRARVMVGEGDGGAPAGHVGEVLPAITEGLDIPARIFVAEVDLDALLERMPAGVRYEKTARFPALKRDLAVVVPADVPEAAVRRLIISEGGPLLRGVDLFDVYSGEQIPEGTVSLAYSVVFQSDDRTLQEDEAADLQKKIEDSIANKLGGRLRSN
jgi:phenylalanyl-tRNA synthetase beta chain